MRKKSALHLFWTGFFGCVALLWIIQGFRTTRGMRRLPRLADMTPLADPECPLVSVIFAARDEAEKLRSALETLLAQDYPRYEVVAVDDRSKDATPQILDEFARTSNRLKVVHIAELPAGWLGKTHALFCGYEQATGAWLVFTDADVHFAPDLLRRAVALAQARALDHLTLLGSLDLQGFWEKTATTYFGVGFLFAVEPWRVHDARSRRYMGAGYFQLLRRSAYKAIGTHQRLAMEIVDDMKLGKLVKFGGFRSGVAIADQHVRLRWNHGLRGLLHGVTKNLFAANSFSLARVVADIAAIFSISILPFLALPLTSGLAQAFAGVAAIVALAIHTQCARNYQIGWAYGFTHPLAGLIFAYMLLRSAVVTLRRGGVEWRGTFYPLNELKRGMV